MLKAPVDLLWNGGIGTYVKAAREAHADVGDRANDAVRVNGGELQAKVVGEGGNLGFTQLGRIEYALHGGRINTDFIDNSGGVDCSDHEVNIKILLNQVVADGDMTRKQRDKLLADMTDDVATAGAAGQLPPGAGDQRHRGPGAPAAGRARPAHAPPGAGQPARPAARVPAQQRGAGRAPGRRQGPDPARAGRAAGLRQDRPPGGAGRLGRARGRVPGRRPGALHAAQAAGEVPQAAPPAPAAPRHHRHLRHQQHGQPGREHLRQPAPGRDRGQRRPTSPGPTRWPARCSTSAGSGRTWPPWTTWSRPTCSWSCRPRGAR